MRRCACSQPWGCTHSINCRLHGEVKEGNFIEPGSSQDPYTKRLDFLQRLRVVNGERAEAWAEGSPSDPLFWAVELGGETGEILNEVKKLRRQELGWRGSRTTVGKLADELADGLICLDSLARHYGVDLAEAVTRKFNATSDKVNLPYKL